MKIVAAAFALFGLVVSARCGEKPDLPWRQTAPPLVLTGNARIDFVGQTELATAPHATDETGNAEGPSRKSPWLAGGMSLVIPGSGEFYTGSYLKSALFFGVEAVLWVVAYTYDKKGDNKTNDFQNFADQHWSVVRYAQWTLNHASDINSGVDPAGFADVVVGNQVNWSELNRLEQALGGWYSHSLPRHGTQQYYELIGKYEQFAEGWDDMSQQLDPTYDVIKANLSSNFLSYSVERGVANNYYTKASTAIAVVVVNHVVSALDAAWSAGSYNRLHAELGLHNVPGKNGIEQVPVVKVSYAF